jgi:hypothetical protein
VLLGGDDDRRRPVRPRCRFILPPTPWGNTRGRKGEVDVSNVTRGEGVIKITLTPVSVSKTGDKSRALTAVATRIHRQPAIRPVTR